VDEVCGAIHGINNPCWIVSQSKILPFHSRLFSNETVDKIFQVKNICKNWETIITLSNITSSNMVQYSTLLYLRHELPQIQ